MIKSGEWGLWESVEGRRSGKEGSRENKNNLKKKDRTLDKTVILAFP